MQNELQQAKDALHSISTSEKSVSSKITTALHHLENLTKHAREFDDNEAQTSVDTPVEQPEVQVDTPESENPQESTTTTDPSTDTTVATA
jgi:hypothetical protein